MGLGRVSVKLILAVLQLAFVFWVAWAKANNDKKEMAKDLKKEAEDAIKSKDIPRVHAIIERIGRL